MLNKNFVNEIVKHAKDSSGDDLEKVITDSIYNAITSTEYLRFVTEYANEQLGRKLEQQNRGLG